MSRLLRPVKTAKNATVYVNPEHIAFIRQGEVYDARGEKVDGCLIYLGDAPDAIASIEPIVDVVERMGRP